MIRKTISFWLSILFVFQIMMIPISANNDISYSWYCKRTKDNLQPPLPEEFNFINEYDSYYIGNDCNDKTVYLTFDAGYENGNVGRTLDILKNNNVKGAFFILSNLIKTSPDIVDRMANEGHTVCNHTSTHKDVSKMQDYETFNKELCDLEKIYKERTGREVSKFFRPPEGRFSEKSLMYARKMGYKTIFWSFAYADWDNNNQMPKESAKMKILDNIHNGAILLLHPTSDVNVAILDDVIKKLKELGYSFGTLDELITKNENKKA